MGVAEDAKKAVKAFEEANPKMKGKATLTSGSRTWEEQLDIILDPKRKENYKNIKANFLKQFKDVKELPAKRKDLTKEQLTWWEDEIMKQAGKSPGFPHVGGKAQDIVVGGFKLDEKKALVEKLEEAKLKILYEYVTKNESEYNVSLSKANVFHVHK
jgi:hypothetical protein